MAVKSKSSVKAKTSIKPKTASKHKVAVKPKKAINSKKSDFPPLSEDITSNLGVHDEWNVAQSEERYRKILDEMAEAYYELDLDGNYTFVNDALCRHMGYTKDELIGVNARSHISKEDVDNVSKAFTNIYTTGKPAREIPYAFIRKDGTTGFAENTGSPLLNQKGAIIGFRGIVQDTTERRQTEAALRQSEEKHRNIIENIQDGYFEVDLDGNFTFFNEAMREIHGYPKEELMGMNHRQSADKENAKKVFKAFNEIYKTGITGSIFDYEIIRKDGTRRQVEVSASLQKDASGKPIGFRGISRDITERKKMEETIRQSEERYRTILDEMEDGYFELDLAGNFTFANEADCRLLGYPKEELIGSNFRSQIAKEEFDTVYGAFSNIYITGKPQRGISYKAIRKDGSTGYAEVAGFPLRNQKGEIIGFRGIGRDITARKLTEEKIQYMATHDSLTGLPNRLMFSQLLNHAIQSANRYKRQIAVLFLDLDRFKNINDTMGHEAGDLLLKEIATRLKQTLRAVDVVSRLGGDEFVVLIDEVSNTNHVATVAHKILTSIINPLTIMGQECRITASIGISIYPKDAEDDQTLMKNADMAMYLAKEEGKNNYQFYADDIQSKSLEHQSIETNLRLALERNEFSLHYQAKVDFKTNAITGVEALLRWQNPSLGSVTPTQFIPVAEETGLIVSIGRWVMRTACAQNVAWQQQGLPPICMAVNLSLRQLTDDNLIDDIRMALHDSGMAPNLLELEITESMVMHNPARMISILAKIKSVGVRLAIDDFGTGYASLAQIKHFPVDTLKVDRSFIRNIPQDAEDKAITEAIIAMGKTLSLRVVAEGVETLEQMNFLKDHSCDDMQGYYFSKPIVPEQFADLLRKHVPSPLK